MLGNRRSSKFLKSSRLQVEKLEQRTLLSINPGDHGHDHGDPSSGADFYMPTPAFKFERGGFLTAPSADAPELIARNYFAAHAVEFNASPQDIANMELTDHTWSSHNGIHHLYFRQVVNGIEVRNADLNINVMPDGRVVNAGGTFVSGLNPAALPTTPQITVVDAFKAAAGIFNVPVVGEPQTLQTVGGPERAGKLSGAGVSQDDVPFRLQYIPNDQKGVDLAWTMVLHMYDDHRWYDASIDATTSQLVMNDNWYENATYQVFPLPLADPADGPRTSEVDPQHPLGSPFGWHDTNGQIGPEFTDTRGNNVNAQLDDDANNQGAAWPSGGQNLVFSFPLNLNGPPSGYVDAAVTNLFYWNNLAHDIHFVYGFDEVSGNFQKMNYSGQGAGNDQVEADAQDGSGMNNANFGTPPDGQSGRMQQFIFNLTNPNRDSDLSAEIILHEFGHGVSNRLTGGPSNAGALNAVQSGGMGEGWSDFYSLMLLQQGSDAQGDSFPVGNYVLGQPATGGGIRRFPYSFDMSINPQTLGMYNASSQVHNAGELWCSVLWDMNWNLINKHGFDPKIYNGYFPQFPRGNTLTLQLVMDGMKLQPANPSFLQARDAILQADQNLTGGANEVEIWTAFARRGFGFSATDGGSNSTSVTEAFDLPPGLGSGGGGGGGGGTVIPGTISGFKFEDIDSDAAYEPNDALNPESGVAGVRIWVDINNNGQYEPGQTPVAVDSTDVPVDLADFTTSTSTVDVADILVTTYDVNVELDITHTYTSDLIISLISPTGQKVRLASGVGGSSNNFVDTVFDDEGTASIATAAAPFTGTFSPLQPLSLFDGEDPNGTWTLEVIDGVAGDVGTIDSWKLTINDVTAEPSAFTLDDDPATTLVNEKGMYTILDVPPGTWTVREEVPDGWLQTSPLGKRIIISEVRLGFPDAFEIQNVSDQDIDTSGWFAAVSDDPFKNINRVNETVFRLPSAVVTTQTHGSVATVNGQTVSTNEVQRLVISGPAGSAFKLWKDGTATQPIPYSVTSSMLDAILEAHSGIGVGSVVVTGGGTTADPFVITFVGALGGTDVPALSATTMAPGAVIYTTDAFGDRYFGTNIFWNGTNNRIGSGWVMLVDGQGGMEDWVGWNWTATELANFRVTVGGRTVPDNGLPAGLGGNWVGQTLSPSNPTSYQRLGNQDTNSRQDFADLGQPTLGRTNGNLTLPFPFAGKPGPYRVTIGQAQALTGIDFGNHDIANPPVSLGGGGGGAGGGGGSGGGSFGGGGGGAGGGTGNPTAEFQTIGLYDRQSGMVMLRNQNTTGEADNTFQFGPAGNTWITLVGDWDGDGTDTVGLYDPARSVFFLVNQNNTANADITLIFGEAGGGYTPLVGDWNGDGRETVGLYRNGLLYLRDNNATGFADYTFQFGTADPVFEVFVGDWNGDDRESVALYRKDLGVFFLTNSFATAVADHTFLFGPGGPGLFPIAGDWDSDGKDTVGLYQQTQARFLFRNTNTSGDADSVAYFGPVSEDCYPLVGDWNGIGTAQLFAGAARVNGVKQSITQRQLRPFVDAAVARWAALGITEAQQQLLRDTPIRVASLSENLLGRTTSSQEILIDNNAAGHGWFVDSTPLSDAEFGRSTGPQRTRVDLLSTVMHEMGHVLGLSHDIGLEEMLGLGERSLPTADMVAELLADHEFDSLLH